MLDRIRTILFFTAALILLTGCGAKQAPADAEATPATQTAVEETTEQTGLANPVHPVDDYTTLVLSAPGTLLSDAPSGATKVNYSYIDGTPVIAQIQFAYGDDTYVYRAAHAEADTEQDISGVYETFDHEETVVTNGGNYQLCYLSGKDMGLATWYNPGTACVYSLYSETGCGISEPIKKVADLLVPMEINVNGKPLVYVTPEPEATPVPETHEVQATVNLLDENDLLVNLDTGETVAFHLTYLAEPAVKQGDVVNITYTGELTDAPEALEVTVTASISAATAVSGTVYSFDSGSVFVQTQDDSIFGFVLIITMVTPCLFNSSRNSMISV